MSGTGAHRPAAPSGIQRAQAEVIRSSPAEAADELRHQAERLGYHSVHDYVRYLRRGERELLSAAEAGWRWWDGPESEHPLDVIRRHMLRGMARAHDELGDRSTFWVRR